MSRTNDCSRRLEGLAPSRSTPGALRKTVCVALLGVTSIAVAGQPPTGPTPSPLNVAVIQGLASPEGVKADAGEETAKATVARPTQPPTAVPLPTTRTSVKADENASVSAPQKPVAPARNSSYPGKPAAIRKEIILGLTIMDVPPSAPKTSPATERPQTAPSPSQQTPAGTSLAMPARPVPPRSAAPQLARAGASGSEVVAPPVTVPPAPRSVSGQPAPLTANIIRGLTRPGGTAGDGASSSAVSEPRPLPPSQMDVIRGVFAPEQAR